jgi:hypothetical protein
MEDSFNISATDRRIITVFHIKIDFSPSLAYIIETFITKRGAFRRNFDEKK